jgi:DNA-binding MarR family transcriptional regulator
MNGVDIMDLCLESFNEMLKTAYRSILKIEETMLRRLSNGALSVSEMHMLESIGKNRDEGVTITDIAQSLDITPPSVTMMVKRLEKKGYITKDRSNVDARRVHIKLTKEGVREEIAHRYFHRQMVKAVTRDLSEEEMSAIITGLGKMINFMQTSIEEFELEREDEK